MSKVFSDKDLEKVKNVQQSYEKWAAEHEAKEKAKWEPLRSKGFEVTFNLPSWMENEDKASLRKAGEEYHNRIIENNPAAEAYDFSGAFENGAKWALDRVKLYIENHVRAVDWLSSPVSSVTTPMSMEDFLERFISDIKKGNV